MSDAYTPVTTIQEPPLPGMPPMHTSTREVPAEFQKLTRGGAVGTFLAQYATHVVYDCQIIPKGDKRVAVVTHFDPTWSIFMSQYSVVGNGAIPPDRFRVDPTEETTSDIVEGNAAMPSLSGSYISKAEGQRDYFTKSISSTIAASLDTGPNKGTSIDQRTGTTFLETIELVDIGSVTDGIEVQSDGSVVTYDPINAKWSTKTTRKAVDTSTKTWTDVVNYEWPPVLTSILFDTYTRVDGGGDAIYPSVDYKEGFYGPQKATIDQYWQKTQPTVITPNQMIPQGFSFSCPLWSLRVQPCLHPEITLYCNIGSADPEWEASAVSRTFQATNLTDWPSEVFWRESKPYMGGYLVTEYTILKPI